MLPTIKELRAAAGGLSNLTDEEIVGATFPQYQQYYGSVDDFAKAVGYGGAGRGLAGSRISAGVDNYQANMFGLGGAVARKAGLDGVASFMDQGRERNEQSAQYAQQRARDLGGTDDWREVDGVGSGLNYLGGLAAQSLPYLGEAVVGGVTGGASLAGTAARVGLGRGAARTAGAVGASYPSAVGDILSAQRDSGGEDLGSAALGGVPYAALNALGVEGMVARGLRPLATGQGGIARRMATGAGVTALGEGIGETGQELVNQSFGRMAVDPNETLFNDEANKRYLDSFVGGAALGGVFGGAGGIRRPRTVDEGQFDLTGQGNPPTEPQYNLTTEMDPLQGRIDQNLGLQRTPLRGYEKQFLEAFNEPSGRFVSDPQTGVERELTAGELQQMQLGELQAQQEATTRREQQIAQETLLGTAQALGVTPVANVNDTYDVLGGRVYGQPQVAKLVQEVAALNQQFSPDQQQLNAAILGANLVSFSGKTGIPTAQKINNAVNGKLKQLQLEGVDSVARAAEILNDQVATLVAAGKNEGDVKLGQIATVYEKLTGQTPPALADAPAPVAQNQQGKPNVSQAATPAGAVAPSVDGRSPVVPGSVGDTGRNAAVDQGVGGDAGNPGAAAQQAAPVPDANVQQPAAVGASQLLDSLPNGGFGPDEVSVDDRKLTKDIVDKIVSDGVAGDQPNEIILNRLNRTTRNNLSSAAINALDKFITEQKRPKTIGGLRRGTAPSKDDPFKAMASAPAAAPVTEEDVKATADEVRADLVKVFGERDAAILNDVLIEKMDAADVATKYGVSRGRIAQLAGEGKTGRDEREKLFAKAEREHGLSKEYLRNMMDKLAGQSRAAAPQAEADTGETMVSEGVGVLGDQAQTDLGAAGFSTVDSEGASTSNWKDSASKGTKIQTRQVKAKLEELQSALETAQEQDNEAEVDKLSKEIAKISSEYVTLEEKVASSTQSAFELSENVRELEEKIETARAAGQDTIATKNNKMTLAEAEAQVAELQAKVMAQLEKAAKSLAKGTKAPKTVVVPKREVGADLAAAKEKFKSVGRDVTKMERGELELLRGEAELFKNKDMLAKIDAQLGSAPAAPAAETEVEATEERQRYEYPTPLKGAPAYLEPAQRAVVDFMNGDTTREELQQRFADLGMTVAQQRSVTNRIEWFPADFDAVKELIDAKKVEATAATAPKEDSGQALWDSLRKANTELVAYEDLTDNERGYLTELADRTGGKPKLKDELGLQELMNRTTGQVMRMVRGDTVDVITPDLKFEGSITDEASLRRFPGFEAAIKHYEKNDLRHVVDGVELWMIAPDTVDFDAAILEVDGKQTLAIRAGILTNTERLEWAMHHEIGHVADDAFRSGGVHSEAQEFNARVSGDKLIPMGAVMREIVSFRDNNPDSDFAKTMKYPLDRKAHGKLDAYEVRMETFAQLWAMFNTRDGREFMEDNLPATTEAMEIAYEASKQDQGRAAPEADGAGAGQGAGVQANRGAQGGAATVSQIRRLNKELTPRAVKPQVNLLTRTLRTGADAALNKIVFSEDLFKRASKMGLRAAMDMDRIYRERAALTGNIEREVTRIENLYNRIPESAKGTGANSANQFLYDSTRENKWGFTPTWRGKDASKVKVDPAIAQRYNALPKEAQAWVSAVLEHGDKMLKMKKDTLIASTNSEYDALIADAKQRGETNKVTRLENDKAASLKQFQRLFATTEFNPYAPMRRFGDFVVIGKSQAYLDATPAERTKMESDPDHYHVSFAESRASALELERQLNEQGSFSEVSARAKEDARGDMYGGLMDAFNKLRGNIESELNNATEPKEIAALRAARETVAELYLQSLAENSARKSEMRRRGVAGEIDMLRSFSTQGRADAHFLASAKYNPQTQEAVVKMRQQAKEGGGQLEKSDAFKEIMARHTQSMRYEQGGWFDVAANTSRVTSIWMLATNPMYYLQNMTQPFVLSLPFMTGKHNWTDASGQLMRAYFQLGDLLKGFKSTEGFDFTKVSKDKDEQDMILKLVDRGRIDIGMDTELGQVKLEGDNIASKAANRTDRVLRSLSQKLEAVNRVSTALAAYRLEIKDGSTPAQALEYADEVISQTHGDYSRINAPRLFNTPGGKVALQFRKFQLIQLTLLSKLFYNSFANSNKAEKAAARKILAFTLAHTGVLAGVVGLPGFAAAAFIINKLADAFGDDDEPYNLENELRKMLGGGDVARLVMRGAPTLAGADLSGKLGMGNALSILPYTDFDASREGFNAIAVGLTLGATGGLGARVFQGLGDIKDGDYYRGLLGLAPIGVSQAVKAFVEANRGETNRRGDVLVSADEISTWQSFATLIGWPTSAGAERRFDRQIAFDNKEAFESKASKIKNEYSRAVRANDSDARRTAIEKWQRLQASRREAGFKPQPLSTLMKAPQEQAKRERNTSGGVQFNTQNRQFVQEQTAN
jgi:hypothetical protein